MASDYAELIKKISTYDVPVPRYTSYPTAPYFTENFTPRQWQSNLPKPGSKLSFYLHLPFCKSMCRYCGCTNVISNKAADFCNYTQSLVTEITLLKEAGVYGGMHQLHLGGGTPNHYPTEQLETILKALGQQGSPHPGAEVSFEADPRLVTEAQMQFFAQMGFNRISFGVQDLNPLVQKHIGRIQPATLVEKAINLAKKTGFNHINLDLVYGLPGQTTEGFAQTLQQIAQWRPARLALFNFAYLPQMRANQRSIKPEWLPNPTQKLQMFLQARDALLAAGYVFIGLDHFALPNDPMAQAYQQGTLHRNFQGYTPHDNLEVIALGMSAISQTNRAYAQNVKTLSAYNTMLQNNQLPLLRGLCLTNQDVYRRQVINGLMCTNTLNRTEIEKARPEDVPPIPQSVWQAVNEFANQGWLTEANNQYLLTENGRLIMRNIAALFDARMAQKKTDVRFSQGV